jgi:hypothetical protein
MNTYFRLGILNDFNESYYFLEIRDFPGIQETKVFISDHKPTAATRDIGIFMNYELRGRFLAKEHAWECVKKLIDESKSDYVRVEAESQLHNIKKVLNL